MALTLCCEAFFERMERMDDLLPIEDGGLLDDCDDVLFYQAQKMQIVDSMFDEAEIESNSSTFSNDDVLPCKMLEKENAVVDVTVESKKETEFLDMLGTEKKVAKVCCEGEVDIVLEARRQHRLERNRVSARVSRKRKMAHILMLEKQHIIDKETIAQLRSQVTFLQMQLNVKETAAGVLSSCFSKCKQKTGV